MKPVVVLLVLALGLPADLTRADLDLTAERVRDELIVKFRAGVPVAARQQLRAREPAAQLDFIGAELWKLAPGTSLDQTLATLAADPRIEYAEPNYLCRGLVTPDDPLFGDQWNLHNTGQIAGGVAGRVDADIDAPEAWDVTSGSSSVIVAIVDTGIDYRHADVAANMWTNPGEIAGNGLDDDGNGFVDDIHGWDFENRDADPLDDSNHGTHCAGVIGAVGNNGIGIAGVNWSVRLMAVKFQNASTVGSTADAILAIGYATMMGARVINCSWSSSAYSAALEAAIMAANDEGVFIAAAAGNEGADNDVLPTYPSGYDLPNVISVMATDNRDLPANEVNWSTNHGADSVDLAAPGVRIESTVRNDAYMYLSGTSASAPHVAGALALLRARMPDLPVADVRNVLLHVGVETLPSLTGLCVSGGRLNLHGLIEYVDTVPPSPIDDLTVSMTASNWLELTWTTPADDGMLLDYDLRHAGTPITDQSGWDAATPAAGEPPPSASGAPQTMRVLGLATGSTYHFCLRTRDVHGNLSDLSVSPGGTTLAPPTIAVVQDSLTAALVAGATVTRPLTITNAGVGVLDFAIPHHVADKGSGGPDTFGYDWTDSDTPGGPDFNWIDINGPGTPVTTTGDSNQGPFPIGFAFPFYGRFYTAFQIGTHGCVSLSANMTPPTNLSLPSTEAPGNLLALLWDEMYPGAGMCRYHSDGRRLVIQYTNLDNIGAGGPYTMQMQLYPNGTVEYHYLRVAAPAGGSATIGLQNQDGTDGLTVSHDTAGLHDNLAIRFMPPPDWLVIDPVSGSLAAGASLDVAVTFDPSRLCGKRFEANLHVLSNDPLLPNRTVPVRLDLSAPPELDLNPAALDFGAVSQGALVTRELTFANRGCGDLTISGLAFDDPNFSTAQMLPLVVAIGDSVRVPVAYEPRWVGAHDGVLSVISDDMAAPVRDMPLHGVALEAPDIAVNPTSFSETLPIGGRTTHQVTIANQGQSDLSFTIPAIRYTRPDDRFEPPTPISPAAGLAKSVADSSTGVAGSLGAGGPDVAGYRWTDSDDVRGPEYNWIEIMSSGTGIPFTPGLESCGPYAIGFSFPFYGETFTSFRACANGWISLTSTASSPLNIFLPNAAAPKNLIAPYWDDLSFASTGFAYYRSDGERLIVEYSAVPRDGVGGFCSFQVHLYPSGRIEFHYQAVPETLDSATVGIQDATGARGLTVVHNARFLHLGHAIRIEADPPWLSVSPSSGTIPPGGSVDLLLALDAAGWCSAVSEAEIFILSNDPERPEYVVPVTLTALASPDAHLAPAALAIGNVYLAQSVARSVTIANTGCRDLQVAGIALDNPQFSVDVSAPFSVVAGGARTINVAFAPTAVGPASGTLTLLTNDPKATTLTVPLSGTGLYAPSIVATPTALTSIVRPGEQRTATLHIENAGGGPLNFSIGAPMLQDKAGGGGASAAGVPGLGPHLDEPEVIPAGAGGPDGGGYRWLDSDHPGGPTFSWIEIAGTGTAALTCCSDAVSSALQISFAVSFYGAYASRFWVSTDGYIAFTSFGSSTAPNLWLPGTGAVSMVAPFWDDLDLSAPGSGDVWYKIVDGNLVVEWDHVMRLGTATPVTFELILTRSGAIYFQYLSVEGALTTSATVGIQNWNGSVGTQVVYNAPYLHDNLAVMIWTPRWATVSPSAGVVAPGGSTDLTVTFNASGVPLGMHHGQVILMSNDFVNPSVPVQLEMEVKNYVSAVGGELPGRLELGQNVPNPFNPETTIRLALPVSGPVDLRIYDLRGALIRTLAAGELAAGYHDLIWDGRTDRGSQAPSGTYFYRLRSDGAELTRRMLLLR